MAPDVESFDYQGMRDECLLPFLGGSPQIRTTRYDHRADAAKVIDAIDVPTEAGLVLDGVFLLRPEPLAHILVDNEHGDTPLVERWTVPDWHCSGLALFRADTVPG